MAARCPIGCRPPRLADEDDVAWTYREPLREAAEVTGRLAFFNERVDLVVAGNVLEHPITPSSRP